MTPISHSGRHLFRRIFWKQGAHCLQSCMLAFFLSHPCPAAAPVAFESDPFQDNIRRVFADDQTADVRILFGYEDSKEFDAPWDPLRAENLTSCLIPKGFRNVTITTELADELGVPSSAPNLRVLEGPGMPGQTLRVAIMWSAASSTTTYNLGRGSTEQMRRSAEALRFLQKSATDAEVHIYLGHSRSGGGPDTFPPMIRPQFGFRRQKVDHTYYRSSMPGLSSLRRCFKVSREKPMIIAWTGCNSQRHFQDWFAGQLADKRHPTSLLLTTRLAYRDPVRKTIEGRDEGLMATVRLIEALRRHQSGAELREYLSSCEMDVHRNPDKPLWKLLTIPPAELTNPR